MLELTLPRPGGWRQLCEQVSQLHEQRLDLSRPPWEGYFIDGLGTIRTMIVRVRIGLAVMRSPLGALASPLFGAFIAVACGRFEKHEDRPRWRLDDQRLVVF